MNSFDHPPEPGAAIEIAPGLYWARFSLPFALNHINIWCIKEPYGWSVVDTGFADEASQMAWETLIETLFDNEPIVRIVATHFHPDHIGMAGWLQRKYGADFLISRTEWLFARLLARGDDAATVAAGKAFYRLAGCQDRVAAQCIDRMMGYAKGVTPISEVFHRLQDGKHIELGGRDWQIIIGHGHSPEHVCLYSEADQILIVGDQVLPEITPNISVFQAEPEANQLKEFLDSLQKFSQIPDTCLALPGHGMPFYKIAARATILADFHRQRLVETLDICRTPQTVFTATQSLFPRALDQHQLVFALGETLAHLNYLVEQKKLVVSRNEDGIKILLTPR